MDDERTPHEAEARLRAALKEADAERLRAALRPGDAVSHRIAMRALQAAAARSGQSEQPRRPHLLAALALIALVVALGIGAWLSHRSTAVAVAVAPTLPLAITGEGSVVVVEHADGRRWIVGPPPEPRAGGN